MEYITEAELLAVKEGTYTMYVFKDLIENKFIMCTRLPNWQVQEINIGDVGYLKIKEVCAGDNYVDVDNTKHNYKYDNIYFENFVAKSESKQKQIIL